MNLIVRLIRIVIAALMRPRLDMLDTSIVSMRVWPNDLDLNLHMNNGRYFTVMDLGRIDLMIRTGVARWMWRQKWTPVVGSETMRFKRALKPFQPYRLKTRVLCWDERWVFLEQRFETLAGELVALGIVKAVLTAQRRTLRPKEALKIMGMLRRSPAMSPAVKAWALAEEWMAEPRTAAVPPEVEELTEPAKPELAALAPAATETVEAEPRPGRFTAWRRKAAPAPAAAELEAVPAPPAPEPVPEPAASPPEQMVPADAPEPPPGRFGQWRRRRAS
jgi:acyl-CoA thioesterase FadM